MGKKSKKVENKTLIYCGPSVTKGMLQQYSCYKDGVPKHLNNYIKQCPSIGALLVCVDDFTKTKQAIQVKGSVENELYNNVLQFIKKGGA